MKKRLLALMLVLAAVLMTACGGKAYTPGTFTNAGYESEYLGFRFNTPEGFILSNQEELSEMMGGVMDDMENVSELQKKYAELVTIYELMASSPNGTNVIVMLEKTNLSVSKYLEAFKEQLAGQMQGMEVNIHEGTVEEELAGTTYTKLTVDISAYGATMTQDYYFRKADDRIVCVTLTWSEQLADEKDAILNAFAAY